MTGMPLMRPLFFEDDSDRSLIDEKDAYLWGDAFLVAPVTEPGVDSVGVNLPDGAWFSFWDDRRYTGGGHVEIPVTMETMPVLVRAGSFVPMTNVVDSTDEYSSEQLTLHYYADITVPAASGRMYDDDGHSRTSLDDGAFELLHFHARHDDDTLSINLERDGGEYTDRPERREVTVIVHNWASAAESVSVNGADIPLTRRLPRRGAGAMHDAADATLTVRFDWHRQMVELRINDGGDENID